MKNLLNALALIGGLALSACGPEVGSREWCGDMDEKPKGEWTLDETKEYGANCIFRSNDD